MVEEFQGLESEQVPRSKYFHSSRVPGFSLGFGQRPYNAPVPQRLKVNQQGCKVPYCRVPMFQACKVSKIRNRSKFQACGSQNSIDGLLWFQNCRDSKVAGFQGASPWPTDWVVQSWANRHTTIAGFSRKAQIKHD